MATWNGPNETHGLGEEGSSRSSGTRWGGGGGGATAQNEPEEGERTTPRVTHTPPPAHVTEAGPLSHASSISLFRGQDEPILLTRLHV